MKFSGTKPRITLGGIGWILLLGFLAYRIAPQVEAAFGMGAGDSAAPHFAAQTLGGDSVSLQGLRGQVVLVNFWATWCPPCRFEMPGFQRVYEDRKDQGFVILGISTDHGGERAVREFIFERGITYPVTMATGRVVRDFGGVRALPSSFLIDREGQIRQQVKGIFTEPALRMAVDNLLEEPMRHAAGMGGAR